MISVDELKTLLSYEPTTGVFTYCARQKRARKEQGTVAGFKLGIGYIGIAIGGRGYLAHRLAWLYMYGRWPTNVDHKNHIRSDNRICNLQEVTRSENQKNMSLPYNSVSGFTGVSLSLYGRWRARITHQGKCITLGIFATKTEAIEARKKANREYGFHPNHGINLTQEGISIMATRQPSKILSVSEIKAAKTEASTAVKAAQASAKEVSNALNAHRKAFAATKAAAVKAHDLALKQLDKDNTAKDKELVKAHLAATKSVEVAQKALDKVTPTATPSTTAAVA